MQKSEILHNGPWSGLQKAMKKPVTAQESAMREVSVVDQLAMPWNKQVSDRSVPLESDARHWKTATEPTKQIPRTTEAQRNTKRNDVDIRADTITVITTLAQIYDTQEVNVEVPHKEVSLYSNPSYRIRFMVGPTKFVMRSTTYFWHTGTKLHLFNEANLLLEWTRLIQQLPTMGLRAADKPIKQYPLSALFGSLFKWEICKFLTVSA